MDSNLESIDQLMAMDEYWRNFIQCKILEPIEVLLQGQNPGVESIELRVNLNSCVTNNKNEFLVEVLHPLLEEYLFEPYKRMNVRYDLNQTEPEKNRYAAVCLLSDCVNRYVNVGILFKGKDLQSVIEGWICQAKTGSSDMYNHLNYLVSAIRYGIEFDWQQLKTQVEPELKNCPSDYDKVRLEYYCILDAIVKIMLDENSTVDTKYKYLEQLQQNRKVLSAIYSVMTGRIIYTSYTHFSNVLSQFKENGTKQYARLICAAINHHPQVLDNLTTKRGKQIPQKIKDAINEVEQNRDLDNLCKILFPTDQWDEYDIDAPRMTMAEMMSKLHETQELKRLLENAEQVAHYLREELNDAIKMESITDAFDKIEPGTAYNIFAQLDMVLEGKNEVWDKYRKQLKQVIVQKREDTLFISHNIQENTMLVASSSFQTASQSKSISITNNISSITINENHKREQKIQIVGDSATAIDNVKTYNKNK